MLVLAGGGRTEKGHGGASQQVETFCTLLEVGAMWCMCICKKSLKISTFHDMRIICQYATEDQYHM